MNLPIERIGGKIRALRKKQAQTLEDLSQSTGLSKGLLSQVERGISQPSLETLWKITKALDTSIVHFFEDVSVNQVNIVRKEHRRQIVYPGTTAGFELLGQSNNSRLKMLELCIQSEESIDLQIVHSEGEESIIVLEGELSLKVGEEQYLLKEGDSIFFDSHLSPKLINEGQQAVRCVFTSLGKL
ncbi:MAG TPA: XRE family transcriptional regulator [Bacillota bacterium]|nr:XRE family transcriptional regulator [Bacillota bacterium]